MQRKPVAQKWPLKRPGLPTKARQLLGQKAGRCCLEYIVTADKTAFPMCSIKATGSKPLSTPLSWLSVMKPPDTDKTQVRTNIALFSEGWNSGICSEVTRSQSDRTNTPQSWEQSSSGYLQREPEFQDQRYREMPGLIYGIRVSP